MTQVNNKKYGIISTKDDIPIIKKMGVKEENLFFIQRSNILMNLIQLGDSICVTSVNSLVGSGGAVALFRTLTYLSSRGVDFFSGNERYLNFSSLKPLSAVTIETLRNIAQREYELVQFIQNCRLNGNVSSQLVRRVQTESMLTIYLVFRNTGILKRGN